MSIIAGLIDDHKYMLKLLRQLEQQIKRVSGLEKEPLELDILLEIVDYIKEYPTIYHHKIEEAMFKLLTEKNLEDEKISLIEKVSDEHGILNALAELLDIKIAECLLKKEKHISLLNTANLFLNQQIRHIKIEHNVLFPLCEEMLTEQDWIQLEEFSNKLVQESDDIPFYKVNRENQSRKHA